jgi:predicted nucleic acid-binding Zn ribbon protein
MGKTFKVRIRKTCLVCPNPVPKGFRTFCSKKCRTKDINNRHYKSQVEWTRRKLDRIASIPDSRKVKCLICGRYYEQVGTHIVQRHKITARKYRELENLPVKRGILPLWLRKIKADAAIQNGTVNNLMAGKKNRYKKHDKRAIINSFYKGRSQEMKRLSQDIYPHKV